MTNVYPKASRWSAGLCNASILLYTFWLLLPAVQTTGRAVTGCAAVLLFAAGVLLDGAYLKARWLSLGLRALSAALLPLGLYAFMGRGGSNFWGFYVQNAMLWFPLIFCAYAREKGDQRLFPGLKPLLLAVVTVTTLTTIGWLIEGMLRGGRVYAYSRSLGNAEPGREAYLKELMLRNIGGYDFVYATVIALPLTCLGIQACRGWRRAGFAALLAAQAVMVALSQYTYAMIFAAVILAAEAIGAVLRKLFKLKTGPSLALGVLPLLLGWLFCRPLAAWAAGLCDSVGLTNFSYSLNQLAAALSGGATDDTGRLALYRQAVEGFRRSPMLGSALGGQRLLSQHSDILDLLSGAGLIGATAAGVMLWLMGRGSLRGVGEHPCRSQLAVMALALFAVAALGSVVYSRDVMLIAAAGTLLVLEGRTAAEDGREL